MTDLTQLLRRISQGEDSLKEQVYEEIYGELRRLAQFAMRDGILVLRYSPRRSSMKPI